MTGTHPVPQRDYSRLVSELENEYVRRAPRSAALHGRAKAVLVDGGSHTLRLIRPFPPRIASASGGWVIDEDGHRILDFWQGHHANILGHNPSVITEALQRQLAKGQGLQTGFTDSLQIETAELLCRQTGMERVRFTTSGSLATMYATLLARAFTGRELVMKIGGGWHGAQPWALKGVDFHAEDHTDFQHVETTGLPEAIAEEVVVTRFNDPEMLRSHFRRYGDQLACFILEPFIGAGGCLAAEPEYLREARELTGKHGVVLILDEVISGFRFHPGLAAQLYDVKPDLVTLAKIIGGGMPVAAVAGTTELMELATRSGGVRFSGGTYSGHPASLLAARTMLSYLVEHEAEIYPHLHSLGELTRQEIETAFASEGIYVRCTGAPNAVMPGSSIGTLLFPHHEHFEFRAPEDTRNPNVVDVRLSDQVLQLLLLVEDVHVVHGLGSLCTAHTEKNVYRFAEACRSAARRLKPYF
jgi:glutamate-1-semialdehyde 2,1-aminomutase